MSVRQQPIISYLISFYRWLYSYETRNIVYTSGYCISFLLNMAITCCLLHFCTVYFYTLHTHLCTFGFDGECMHVWCMNCATVAIWTLISGQSSSTRWTSLDFLILVIYECSISICIAVEVIHMFALPSTLSICRWFVQSTVYYPNWCLYSPQSLLPLTWHLNTMS